MSSSSLGCVGEGCLQLIHAPRDLGFSFLQDEQVHGSHVVQGFGFCWVVSVLQMVRVILLLGGVLSIWERNVRLRLGGSRVCELCPNWFG